MKNKLASLPGNAPDRVALAQELLRLQGNRGAADIAVQKRPTPSSVREAFVRRQVEGRLIYILESPGKALEGQKKRIKESYPKGFELDELSRQRLADDNRALATIGKARSTVAAQVALAKSDKPARVRLSGSSPTVEFFT